MRGCRARRGHPAALTPASIAGTLFALIVSLLAVVPRARSSMESAERDHLRQMLLDRSMRFGEFVLSSGVTSNYYIDVRKTSLHPEGLRWISKLFFEALQADQVTAVGGLTLGADPLVAGVILH